VVEKRADVTVLDGAAKQVASPGDDLRIGDGAIARGEDRPDRLRQPDFVRGEQPAAGHAQGIAGAKPADDERGRIRGRLDGQPGVRR
jgi:hypothetical protein